MKGAFLCLLALALVACGNSGFFAPRPTDLPTTQYSTPATTPKPLLPKFTPSPTPTRLTPTPFPTWTPRPTPIPVAKTILGEGASALFYFPKTGRSVRIYFLDYAKGIITFRRHSNAESAEFDEVVLEACRQGDDGSCWTYALILNDGSSTEFRIEILPMGYGRAPYARVTSPPGWIWKGE